MDLFMVPISVFEHKLTADRALDMDFKMDALNMLDNMALVLALVAANTAVPNTVDFDQAVGDSVLHSVVT